MRRGSNPRSSNFSTDILELISVGYKFTKTKIRQRNAQGTDKPGLVVAAAATPNPLSVVQTRERRFLPCIYSLGLDRDNVCKFMWVSV